MEKMFLQEYSAQPPEIEDWEFKKPVSKIEQKLKALGVSLPAPMRIPDGVSLPFAMVNVRGDRAIISGHGPLELDGSIAGPFRKVGVDVTLEEAKVCARKTALAMIDSLQRELGDLDRITGWGRVLGMVNAAPDFDRHPLVINGFSEVILDVFGPVIGRHSRSAVGLASLPFNIAVEIEADVMIRP